MHHAESDGKDMINIQKRVDSFEMIAYFDIRQYCPYVVQKLNAFLPFKLLRFVFSLF